MQHTSYHRHLGEIELNCKIKREITLDFEHVLARLFVAIWDLSHHIMASAVAEVKTSADVAADDTVTITCKPSDPRYAEFKVPHTPL